MRLGNPNITIDSAAEENGKWIDCPIEWTYPGKQRPQICVCGIESRTWRAALREAKLDKIPQEQGEEKLSELIGIHLLKGMKNFVDAQGNDITYTQEIGKQALTNRDNREFADFVYLAASSRKTFRMNGIEDDQKN